MRRIRGGGGREAQNDFHDQTNEYQNDLKKTKGIKFQGHSGTSIGYAYQ